MTFSTQTVFPYLIDYLNRNDGMTNDLFELLLLYINHGNDFLAKDVHSITKFFLDIFKFSLDEIGKYESSFILGCGLIQIFLQKINFIPFNFVKDIISYSIFMLNSITIDLPSQDDNKKYFSLHKINALIAIIFSGMLNYPSFVINILIEKNEMINFILWNDIILKSRFAYPYIIKVNLKI